MEAKIVKDPQIDISKELRKIFDDMKSYDEFKKLENKDLFILAVIFGYMNGKTKPLVSKDKTDSGFTRERYLSPSDNSILKAIAIADTGSIDIINDMPKIYDIAEQYANGGSNYLKEFVFDDPASFTKKYASMLKELCSESSA